MTEHEQRVIRLQAEAIRRRLLRGVPRDSSLRVIVNEMADEVLIAKDRQAHAEKVDFLRAKKTSDGRDAEVKHPRLVVIA